VAAGHCLLVVGPSGSGKSTLALAIAGLVPHDIPGEWRGRLHVGGLDVAAVPRDELTARVGLVFQDPGSQVVMDRVEDDVAFGLENRAWSPDAMRARVPDILDAVGLRGLARRRTGHLSGGEQQRLALAGALAPQPGILVLDEPTANLDPWGAAAFFDRLRSIREARTATIVLVEHRAQEAWGLADRVLALAADGAPIDFGPPAPVLARSGTQLRDAGVWLPGDRASAASPSARSEIVGPLLVDARDLTFGYDPDVPVVRHIELDLAAGERVALAGPNGSGKSTLGRLLVGLLRPTDGSVRLGGADPARLRAPELARRAGYVFQDPEQQFLADRVEDEVLLGLRPEERTAADEVMAGLDLPLERFADRSPYALSGGEQRRLSLACILVRRPALLVLDEPTFGQDRHGYEGLLAILRERVAAGTCLVAATHDEHFVRDVAGRRIALEAGRVVADETLVLESPAEAVAARAGIGPAASAP
jgi:energy-coupling factor transport system ATP-binding protein